MFRELNDSELEIVAGGKYEPRKRPVVENKTTVKDSFNNDSFSAGGDITIDIGNVSVG